MSETKNISLTRREFEYDVEIHRIDDIISATNQSDEDKAITKAIISDLEKLVATTVRNMKCANIPYIGNLRINPVKRALRDESLNFKLARKMMTKEQYKEHVASYVVDLKQQLKEKDKHEVYFKKVMRINKKKYDYLFTHFGAGYANMFIFAIISLSEIPFDKEWEEQYQLLSKTNG